MFIVYNKYDSSFLATIVSFFASLSIIGAFCCIVLVVIGTIEGEIQFRDVLFTIGVVALAAFLKWAEHRLAEWGFKNKMKNNIRYIKKYLKEHPDEYEQVLQYSEKFRTYIENEKKRSAEQ